MKSYDPYINQLIDSQIKKNVEYFSSLNIDPDFHAALSAIAIDNLDNVSYRLCLSKIEFDSDHIPVFFDVGCNIDPEIEKLDDFTKVVLAKFPNSKCYGIEPLYWRNYEKEYNRDSRVTLIKKGLSNKMETRKMYTPQFVSENNQLFLGHGGSSFWNRKSFVGNKCIEHDVDCVTLDFLVDQYNLDIIDYLKIDTEGAEYVILQGSEKSLTHKKIKYIQLEFGECFIDSKIKFYDIEKYLNHFEYELIYITGTEALFACTNDLSKSKIVNTQINIEKQNKRGGRFTFFDSFSKIGTIDISFMDNVGNEKQNIIEIPMDDLKALDIAIPNDLCLNPDQKFQRPCRYDFISYQIKKH